MAQRRMFSIKIIDTDFFCDMPISARLLYFELCMRADDDGFISNPKKICRIVGCSDDDLKILRVKNFLIFFENGICVVTHWKIHNYIQKDRYTITIYLNELKQLKISDNNQYEYVGNTTCIQDAYKMDTECIQDVSTLDTQVRLGKDSLVKISLDNIIISKNEEKKISKEIEIYNFWEEMTNKKYNTNTDVYKARIEFISKALKKYDKQSLLDLIEFKVTSPYTQNTDLSAILSPMYLANNLINMNIWLEKGKKHVENKNNFSKNRNKETIEVLHNCNSQFTESKNFDLKDFKRLKERSNNEQL